MIDIELHLAHLLTADAADQAALLRRVAALAWSAGADAGMDWHQTEPEPTNPYSAKETR